MIGILGIFYKTPTFVPYKESIVYHTSKTDLIVSPNNPNLVLPIHGPTKEMVDYTDVTKSEFDLEYTFQDTLRFESTRRGQSSVHVYLSGRVYKSYRMFFDEFCELIRNNTLVNGEITGTWKFQKKGANLGIVQV